VKRTRLVILSISVAGLLLLGLAIPVLAAVPSVTIAAYAYTGPPLLTANDATDVGPSSATLNGEIIYRGSSNVTCRGFEWGYATGNYTVTWNETGEFSEGTFSHDVSGLTGNVDVYWRAFAISAEGQGNSTELSFLTTALPLAPTNFVVTGVGDTMVGISWTMGVRADTTVVRGSSDGYPSSVTDGYLAYSGNETSLTIDSLDLQTSTYYYRAWSYNDYGYSTSYAQGYVGNPLGIPQQTMFIIGLCVSFGMVGFAFWKKGWLRIILSIGVIIWGVYFMSYDVKIAAPLIAVGAVLFIMAILKQIQSAREQAE
jgi:hypothetical protein